MSLSRPLIGPKLRLRLVVESQDDWAGEGQLLRLDSEIPSPSAMHASTIPAVQRVHAEHFWRTSRLRAAVLPSPVYQQGKDGITVYVLLQAQYEVGYRFHTVQQSWPGYSELHNPAAIAATFL